MSHFQQRTLLIDWNTLMHPILRQTVFKAFLLDFHYKIRKKYYLDNQNLFCNNTQDKPLLSCMQYTFVLMVKYKIHHTVWASNMQWCVVKNNFSLINKKVEHQNTMTPYQKIFI